MTKLVTIAGTVVDDDHTPVASAELGLKLNGRTQVLTRSDNAGRFSFADVPLAPGSITVRRLGYHLRTVTLDMVKLNAGEPIELALETVAAEVEPVVIDATTGRMNEFTDHRNQSAFGHFFDQTDIQKIKPRFVSELFRTVPGATIHVSSGIGNTVKLRGCRPRIWVNGVRTVNSEVDEVAAPSEIDGMEVYPSWAGTPAQYMDRENRACGTIVIWTRR
ncbi:MAG TPA: carboxypeptidase regulatory-like domain-containing protein [Gemmatimonadaceae bacterium]|nr:carboxypeptidase regulatory-like domain-containing protein [Gemmatimonadaceae bacterium]